MNTDSSELDDIFDDYELEVASGDFVAGMPKIKAKQAILSRYRSTEDLKKTINELYEHPNTNLQRAKHPHKGRTKRQGIGLIAISRDDLLAALNIGDEK